jgi:hypothetical protein
MKKMSGGKMSEIDLNGQQWVVEHSLMVSRYRLASRWVAGLLLMLCIAIALFSVLTPPDHLRPYQAKPAIKGAVAKDPVLYREVGLLRRQSNALLTGSIETKLRLIETSLRNGKVRAADLEMLQSLREELKLLKNSSSFDPSTRRAVPRPSVARQAGRSSAHLINNEQMLAEMAYMKNLLYVSIASCGLLFVSVGGLWLHSSARLRQLDAKISASRILLDKPHIDHS